MGYETRVCIKMIVVPTHTDESRESADAPPDSVALPLGDISGGTYRDTQKTVVSAKPSEIFKRKTIFRCVTVIGIFRSV